MGKVYKSIEINAPVETVWEAIANFHDMSWSPNVIKTLEVSGDAHGTELGARRILNSAFYETLITFNALEHIIQYRIDEGPSPISSDEISHYIGTLKLSKINTKTLAEWSSEWMHNDEAVTEFCGEMYAALLADLKKTIESRVS